MAYIVRVMTEREADRTRAITMPLFAALMIWNALSADAAPHQWVAAVGALGAAGAAGWFLARLYARPSSLPER